MQEGGATRIALLGESPAGASGQATPGCGAGDHLVAGRCQLPVALSGERSVLRPHQGAVGMRVRVRVCMCGHVSVCVHASAYISLCVFVYVQAQVKTDTPTPDFLEVLAPERTFTVTRRCVCMCVCGKRVCVCGKRVCVYVRVYCMCM